MGNRIGFLIKTRCIVRKVLAPNCDKQYESKIQNNHDTTSRAVGLVLFDQVFLKHQNLRTKGRSAMSRKISNLGS